MDKKLLKEILAAHADRLVRGTAEGDEALDLSDAAELASLLGVAEQVKSTLQPVSPARSFETELKRELLTTAYLRRAEGYTPPNPSRDLLILAALMTLFISILSWFLARRLRGQTI
ncbi:MAG: hypothetical protein Fur0044_52220 [Anaerolineae bacterium]|nr:hypothetical protein [Anaerolineales bacterium]MCQ3975897.1 hypothetical protein [Anaerolineae bacterium]